MALWPSGETRGETSHEVQADEESDGEGPLLESQGEPEPELSREADKSGLRLHASAMQRLQRTHETREAKVEHRGMHVMKQGTGTAT